MIDDYYDRFHELLDELSDADQPISTLCAMRHFIFTLRSDFETVQKNFCIGNLPSEWHTQNWPTLLVLCCDYFHCILKREPSSDGSVINPVDVQLSILCMNIKK